jgi:hypothetical protein
MPPIMPDVLTEGEVCLPTNNRPTLTLLDAIRRDRLPEHARERAEQNPYALQDRYLYADVDLDADGKLEAAVYLISPDVCGSGGCPLLLYRPVANGWQWLGEISNVQPPIAVSSRRSTWNDLVIKSGLLGLSSDYRRLKAKDNTYPDNPSLAPSFRRIAGERLTGLLCGGESSAVTIPMGTASNVLPDIQAEIDGVRIGSTATTTRNKFGPPSSRSLALKRASDGLYESSWIYRGMGLTLTFVAEPGPASLMLKHWRLAAIKLTAPSALRTKKGIGIGSTFAEVEAAYEGTRDQSVIPSQKQIVVGSLYNGLVFRFEAGRVVEIFIGPAAE